MVSDQSVNLPPMTSDYPFTINGVVFANCIKGKARIKLNFHEYLIEENVVITILPYFVVEYLWQSDDLVMEFLIFSTDFITEIPKSGDKRIDISKSIIQSPCISITQEEMCAYMELHSFIVKQHKRTEHPFRTELVKSLLYAMLTEIGAIYYRRYVKDESDATTATSRQVDVVSQFFRLVLENHRGNHDLQFYADKMCLSSKYLSTVIKDKTGKTAFAWINESLVASIKNLLKTTTMTVLQISEELNFPNASFFGRFFKKHTGITPLAYRNS